MILQEKSWLNLICLGMQQPFFIWGKTDSYFIAVLNAHNDLHHKIKSVLKNILHRKLDGKEYGKCMHQELGRGNKLKREEMNTEDGA